MMRKLQIAQMQIDLACLFAIGAACYLDIRNKVLGMVYALLSSVYLLMGAVTLSQLGGN